MATPTYTQVATRWYAIAVTGRGVYLKHPYLRCTKDALIGHDGDVMCQVIRDRKGKIKFFLLNGDGSGGRVRFANQQWEIRGVVQTHERFYPHAVIPFSALAAAEIDRSTIDIVEARPDEWITERTWVDGFDPREIVWNRIDERKEVSRWNVPAQTGTIPDRPDLFFSRAAYRYTGLSGERAYSLIPENERGDGQVYARPWRALLQSGKRWYYDEQRHRLGDSVFRAKAHGAYRTYLSSFDYQERNPLYFLAELPWKARPQNVAEAVLSLAPPIVRQAMEQKRLIRRQGDIFAIPTNLTNEQVRARTDGVRIPMQGVLGTDHVVTEQYVGKRGVTYARGIMYHKPEGRRPDHRRQHMGKKWHLIVPNAVPRRRAGAMVRG